MGRGTIKTTSGEQDDTVNYHNILAATGINQFDSVSMDDITANNSENILPFIPAAEYGIDYETGNEYGTFQFSAYADLQGYIKGRVDSYKQTKTHWIDPATETQKELKWDIVAIEMIMP